MESTFTFTSILCDSPEDERETIPSPEPDEDRETLPTFDFPEGRS